MRVFRGVSGHVSLRRRYQGDRVNFFIKGLVAKDHAGAEGVTHQASLAPGVGPGLEQVEGAQNFLELGLTLTMFTFAIADTAEVEPERDESLFGQPQGQSHHNVVVHRAAVQRVRMADDDAGPRPAGGIGLGDDAFEAEPGSLEGNGALSQGAHPIISNLSVEAILGWAAGFGKASADQARSEKGGPIEERRGPGFLFPPEREWRVG